MPPVKVFDSDWIPKVKGATDKFIAMGLKIQPYACMGGTSKCELLCVKEREEGKERDKKRERKRKMGRIERVRKWRERTSVYDFVYVCTHTRTHKHTNRTQLPQSLSLSLSTKTNIPTCALTREASEFHICAFACQISPTNAMVKIQVHLCSLEAVNMLGGRKRETR